MEVSFFHLDRRSLFGSFCGKPGSQICLFSFSRIICLQSSIVECVAVSCSNRDKIVHFR